MVEMSVPCSVHAASDAELECLNELKTGGLITETPDPEDLGWMSDETLLRFVRARDCNVKKVAAMVNECISWRRSYKPYLITSSDVADILALKTVFISGKCKRGCPILYMTPGLQNPFPAETRVKLMVYLMEETLRRGFTRLTWVFDWRRFGERAKDAESSKTREQVTKILQDFYPERLNSLFMVGTPWYFNLIATLVWPFIDKRTRAKIHMKMTPETLLEHIDSCQLISSLGGQRDPDTAEMLVGSPL